MPEIVNPAVIIGLGGTGKWVLTYVKKNMLDTYSGEMPKTVRLLSFDTTSEKISREGGVADVSGYTDYGRVWLEFLAEISDELDPRSTVIVLGDARTNGREPHAEVFGSICERAGRTFWLNPEPRLYWNYGDSVMAAYERHCTAAFECWTTRHLEGFVNVVAGGTPLAEQA